jgi:hypothetical protein
MTRSVLLRIIREPLFAFVVMGGVLYFAHSQLRSRHSEPVVLQAATRAALIGDFEKLHGRKATADDLARIERDYLTDELLFREALENGLHRSDPSVRSKLVENMRYRITGPLADPTDEQLVNYYSENLDRYRAEPVVTFRQVYFAERPPDPAAVLAQLRQGWPVTGTAANSRVTATACCAACSASRWSSPCRPRRSGNGSGRWSPPTGGTMCAPRSGYPLPSCRSTPCASRLRVISWS